MGFGSSAAAQAQHQPAQSKGGEKKQAQKQGKKNAAKPADDDEMDLFGDDEPTEAPTETMAQRAARMKQEKDEEAKKNKKVERSQILFEVKPVDTETDLNQLYREIVKIQKDGLVWGEGYELKPVAFGIQKLVMSCVVEDEKVGVDDITEPIELLEDWVQSVDVATMNRL